MPAPTPQNRATIRMPAPGRGWDVEHDDRWDSRWEWLWVLLGGALLITASIKSERDAECGEENRPNRASLPCPPGSLPPPATDGSRLAQRREWVLTVHRDHARPTSRSSFLSKPWTGRHMRTHYFTNFHRQSAEMGLTPWKRWGN